MKEIYEKDAIVMEDIMAGKVNNAIKTIGNAGNVVVSKANGLVEVVKNIEVEDVLVASMKVPGVKIDRAEFLRKELSRYYSNEKVELAIQKNPAYAGIPRWSVTKIADECIKYETGKVVMVSAAAGLPGGAAMAATVPADVIQYFGFLIRVLQKIAYLYGIDEFDFDENNIADETMSSLLACLGVMFGVQGANAAVAKLADAVSAKVAKEIIKQPLTKGTVYPMIKKIATALGIKMTKQVLADGASKVVPVVGGAVSGGLTYATFMPSAKRLQKEFKYLKISDPGFYEREKASR